MSETPRPPDELFERIRAFVAALIQRWRGDFRKSLTATAGIEQEKELPAVLPEEPKVFNSARLKELYEEESFRGLARALRPFLDGMNDANATLLKQVLVLMETDLDGVSVERSDFAGKGGGKVRALTTIPRKYGDKSPAKVTLHEAWDPGNGVDLVLAVHELAHVVDFNASKEKLDRATWEKIFAAPGNSVEIRTELVPWELQLVLFDQLSGGLLEASYTELLKVRSQEEADAVLRRFVDQIAEALHVREDQKGMLLRWLQIYYTYKAPQRFNVDCRWMYDFACQIAGEYIRAGAPVYELELDKGDQESDPNRCIDPLPEGPRNYTGYRPYNNKMKSGLTGPGKLVRFE